MKKKYRVAFVGAGGIARAHAYAIASLPYYYQDVPEVERVAVASRTHESRSAFAARYCFAEALAPDELWQLSDIDVVFLASPNEYHCLHLKKALFKMGASRIYVEKPVCVSKEEEAEISKLTKNIPKDTVIQPGFQFLQMSALRHALRWWREDGLGNPIHFHCRYLHSGYLDPEYRQERQWRLKPAPQGGALVDLGSHAFSIIVAFLGKNLEVVSARKSGHFDDVPIKSDLCTTVLLIDKNSGAAGTLTASRISAGAGDLLEIEIRGTQGALRFSTERPDVLEIFRTGQGNWNDIYCGSDYQPATGFPSPKVPGGWLRSLVHAHYLFLGGHDGSHSFIPDLDHALVVQRLIHCAVEKMEIDC